MGEINRFVPKSERERGRLIREARTIYDSIFPSDDPVSQKRNKEPVSHTVEAANAHRSDGVLLSYRDHRCALQPLLSGKLPPGNRHHLGLR
jgi:hypothetical protein